jgi:photosystem II stability/assembly factor-like uncharacterized protein
MTGVIVGLGGSALRTSDGGVTWVKPDSMVRTVLNGATFTSPTKVTAVGASARIFQSLDGGNTWALKFSSGTSSRSLVSVSFGDTVQWFLYGASHGTALGYLGMIVHTDDGGATWQQQFGGTELFLRSVWFSDANTGTAVGDGGTILRTTDGGLTWEPQRSGVIAALTGVWFADADTGTVVGYAGTILRTTNGGLTWFQQNSGTVQNLYDVFFTDTHHGTVVGENGTILRTVNGGE